MKKLACQYEDRSLKEMTKVYIPPSNFYVQPFIGISRYAKFIKQDDEVEAIIEVTLAHFLDDNV